MGSIFTRIFDGEIPGTFVWQDDRCGAFMSINPLRRGHVLIAPRDQIDHWLDAPGDLRDHLFEVAHSVGVAQQAAFAPARVGLMIAGLEVPHLHIHVVPIDDENDLDFANAATSVDRDDLDAAAEEIRAHLPQP